MKPASWLFAAQRLRVGVGIWWAGGRGRIHSRRSRPFAEGFPKVSGSCPEGCLREWRLGGRVDGARRRVRLGAELDGGVVDLLLQQIDGEPNRCEAIEQFRILPHLVDQ